MGWLDDLLGTQFSLGGTLFPRRQYTNFVSGVTIADNPGANRTDVTFSVDDHGSQLMADGIHTTLWKAFNNATDRRAWPLTAADIGKRALQLDTAVMWDVVPSIASPGTYVWGNNSGPELVLSAPGAILGSELAWWIDGVTSTIVDAGGGLASSASDATGHGYAATFAAGQRPSIIASGLNTKKTLRFTSAQYGGNTAFSAPAPGTTPIYTFMVVKSGTAIANSVFLGTSAAGNIYLGTGTKVNDFNGGAGAQSGVVTAGTWYIIEVLRSNQASDYAQLGGVAGVAANAGNSANTGWTMNANSAGGLVGDNEFATVFQWLGTPTGTQRTNLRAWANSVWGV